MRTGMIALALGLVALRFLPALPPSLAVAADAGGGIDAAAVSHYPVALFLLGFTWACVSAQWALNDRLSQRLDGQTLWVQGKVVGLPSVAEGVVRFELEDAPGMAVPRYAVASAGVWRSNSSVLAGWSIRMPSIIRPGCWRSVSVRPALWQTANCWPRRVGRGATAFDSGCWRSMRRAGKAGWPR